MITGTGSNGYISRNSSSWLDLTADWTISFYVKYYDDPAGFVVFKYCSSDFTYTQPYIFLENSSAGVRDLKLEVYNGTGTASFTPVAAILDTDYYISIRYTESTHAIEFIIDGVVQESKTLDLLAFTDTSVDAYLNDTGSDDSKISVAYERIYQRVLTTSEILIEKASVTPVSNTSILTSCPLQTSIDLTDHVQDQLAVFFATGTVTTDTTDPLLSVVAGPPANTTPNSAIELSLDSAYFQDMVSGGSAVPAGWYFVHADRNEFWGMFVFGDLTVYKPSMTVYEGLANALANIPYEELDSDLNSPMQGNVNSGNDYYFKVSRNGAVSPAIAQISIIRALELPVPVGSIMINDDVLGYIAALDVNTGYPIHFFSVPLNPAGEGGCPLNDGKIILCKDVNAKPVLYDSGFNLITELNITGIGTGAVSSNLTNKFAVGQWPTGSNVYLVNPDGTVDPTIYNTGLGNAQALGLNVNASKFYFCPNSQPVKTWIIATNSAGPDLLPLSGTAFVSKGPIIVLQDGKIVVPYIVVSNSHFTVKIVDDTGSLISTYDFGKIINGNDNRLATDPADPTFFWAWGKEPDSFSGFSFFKKVKTSDGSTPVNLTHIVQYEDGRYNGNDGGEINTPVRFGHSESCPFWINRVVLFPAAVTRSGIYYLTGTSPSLPTQRHDTLWIDASLGTSEDVKIP